MKPPAAFLHASGSLHTVPRLDVIKCEKGGLWKSKGRFRLTQPRPATRRDNKAKLAQPCKQEVFRTQQEVS